MPSPPPRGEPLVCYRVVIIVTKSPSGGLAQAPRPRRLLRLPRRTRHAVKLPLALAPPEHVVPQEAFHVQQQHADVVCRAELGRTRCQLDRNFLQWRVNSSIN